VCDGGTGGCGSRGESLGMLGLMGVDGDGYVDMAVGMEVLLGHGILNELGEGPGKEYVVLVCLSCLCVDLLLL
jgi:hypothetical protein